MADNEFSKFQRVMSRMRWPGRVLVILTLALALGALVMGIMAWGVPRDMQLGSLYVSVLVVPAVVIGTLITGLGRAARVPLPARSPPLKAKVVTVVGYAIMTASALATQRPGVNWAEVDTDVVSLSVFLLGAVVLLGGIVHLVVARKRSEGWLALVVWNLLGLVYPIALWAVLDAAL